MSEFEEYARSVTTGLDLPEAMKIRIAEEVVTHLEDETRRCMTQHMSRPDAERAAIERFGGEQTIAQLVAQALERRQTRFRLSRSLKMALAATLCVVLSVAVGAWFTIFKDAVAGREFMSRLPEMIGMTLYAGGFFGSLAILGVIVAVIFRVRKSVSIAAFIVVAIIFYASMNVFSAIPALRETIGTIRGGESEYTLVLHAFCMRLYVCWVPTLVTGIIIAVLVRRRAYLLWGAATLIIGLLSSLLWGFNHLIYKAPWMYWMKWPKLLSTGLLALVFVMLAGFLARAIAERFGWNLDRSAPSFTVPTMDDHVETA